MDNYSFNHSKIALIASQSNQNKKRCVKTHLFLGEDKLVEMLSRFKITNNALPIPSLALGTHEVTLQKLTEGYSALANLGVLCDIKRLCVKLISRAAVCAVID